MSKKPRRVRMVDCPYCGSSVPVDPATRCDDELLRITACGSCYAVIDNEKHPGELVEVNSD